MNRRRLITFFTLSWLPALGRAESISSSVFNDVGSSKGIDPYLLYAIALAESAYSTKGTSTISPWQFALRTKTRAFYGQSYEETAAELKRILKTTDSVDVGLMQINSKWHSHRVSRIEDLLDVKTNISIAADILNERLKANQNNMFLSLAQYHSFDDARGSWYASFVLGIYAQITNTNSHLVFAW